VKGRAGGGVRCHKLLKADTCLTHAAVVSGTPTVVVDGELFTLEDHLGKRDGSGEVLEGAISDLAAQR
jgi:hypothetical protein